MSDEQKAAYVNAQAVACMCELQGMLALNAERERAGHSPAYDDGAFIDLPARFAITHNQVLGLFHDR